MAQAPPDIPRIPDLFESVDAALEVLGVIEGQDLARSIADALGGTDRSPFPERLRAPRVDDQPEGWTLFSGVDRYVDEGLRTPASRVALDGAPWLHQPEGSPSFGDQRPRGHMIFPQKPRTTRRPRRCTRRCHRWVASRPGRRRDSAGRPIPDRA
ncbi:MAG: hypothetical protein U0Y82_02740 [Thermoleophilia bacterium]